MGSGVCSLIFPDLSKLALVVFFSPSPIVKVLGFERLARVGGRLVNVEFLALCRGELVPEPCALFMDVWLCTEAGEPDRLLGLAGLPTPEGGPLPGFCTSPQDVSAGLLTELCGSVWSCTSLIALFVPVLCTDGGPVLPLGHIFATPDCTALNPALPNIKSSEGFL